MSQKLKVELQDENGNIYYLHTAADVVYLDDGTTVETALEKKVTASGGDISNTKLATLTASSASFPVPATGDAPKTLWGKVKKWQQDCLAKFANYVLTSAITNQYLNDTSKIPTAALMYLLKQEVNGLNSDKGKAIYSSDLFQNYQTPIFVRWDANTENTPFKAGLTTAQLGFAFIYGNPNNYFTAVAIAQSERRIYTYSKTPENVNSWQRSALQEELPLYFSLNFGTIQSKQEVSRQVSFENPLINSYFSAIITTNSKVSYWADIVYLITNKTVNGCTITAYNNGGNTTGTITADCMIVPQRTFNE